MAVVGWRLPFELVTAVLWQWQGIDKIDWNKAEDGGELQASGQVPLS
jgi:hypothetical protein